MSDEPSNEYKPAITKWEAGNELVAAADALSKAIHELNKDWPELAQAAKDARQIIAEKFNTELIGEMGFGI